MNLFGFEEVKIKIATRPGVQKFGQCMHISWMAWL